MILFSNKLPHDLFGTNLYKTLESYWLSLSTISKWTNNTYGIFKCGTFLPFLSLVTLFSVLPCNFIVSGIKRSR